MCCMRNDDGVCTAPEAATHNTRTQAPPNPASIRSGVEWIVGMPSIWRVLDRDHH